MKYDFDEIVDRKGTHSIKWESGGHGDVDYCDYSLPFSIADMEFNVAPPIVEAMQKRLVGNNIYGYTIGQTEEYLLPVANYFKRHYDWEINTDYMHLTRTVVDGVRECVNRFTSKGDGILLQLPAYTPFMNVIKSEGRLMEVNELSCDEEGNYTIDFVDFERQCKKPTTKMFILCSPHNPVGRVWTKDELTAMADICAKYNVLLLSDEIHCDFTRIGGVKHYPLMKLRPHNDIITCVSASKTFNIAGLELAYVIFSNKKLKDVVNSSAAKEVANPLSLEANKAAYSLCDDWVEQVKQYIDDNFKFLQKWLNDNMPLINFNIPEGTYVAWVDFRPYFASSDEFARYCGKHAHITFEQGEVYGQGGEGFARINLACSRAMLAEGLDRLKKYVLDRVKVGDKIGDVVFDTQFEQQQSMLKVSANKRKLLVFLRYWGCNTCRLDLADYQANIDKFKAKNIDVYCILQSDKTTLEQDNVTAATFDFKIALDSDMKLYKQFNVLPTLAEDVKLLVTEKDMAKIKASMKAGFKHGKYEGNEYQLPALVLLDVDNKVEYAHYAATLADFPMAEELLGIIK